MVRSASVVRSSLSMTSSETDTRAWILPNFTGIILTPCLLYVLVVTRLDADTHLLYRSTRGNRSAVSRSAAVCAPSGTRDGSQRVLAPSRTRWNDVSLPLIADQTTLISSVRYIILLCGLYLQILFLAPLFSTQPFYVNISDCTHWYWRAMHVVYYYLGRQQPTQFSNNLIDYIVECVTTSDFLILQVSYNISDKN